MVDRINILTWASLETQIVYSGLGVDDEERTVPSLLEMDDVMLTGGHGIVPSIYPKRLFVTRKGCIIVFQ